MGKMNKPLLMTTVKNRFKKVGEYEFYLKNININGVKKGCSGFIKNPQNEKIVYINTESSCYQPLSDKILYRTAESLRDWTGGRNQWCKEDELVKSVSMILEGVK